MTMRWSAHPGASSYKVTATPKNSPEPSVFAQFSGSSLMGSVNSLSPNTLYTMRVEAMDSALNVLSSAVTDKLTAPEVPAITQAYSKHDNSMTVEFGEVAGASGYVLRAESEADDYLAETAVSGSPGTVLQLRPYTDYVLSVMSVNAGGRSQPSWSVQSKTVVVAPDLMSSSPSNSTIVVTWSPVTNAVGYTLCIIEQGSTSRLKVNATNTTVTFDNLKPGTIYSIKGNAWDPEGRPGNDLTIVQITRPPTPEPVQVMMSQGRSVGIVVYWPTVQGADSYVARSTTGQNCTSSVDFCMITPLDCGLSHTLTVTAQNTAGPSGPSSPQALTTYPCPPDHTWVEEPVAGNCSVAWSAVALANSYMTFIKRDDGSEEHCNTTATTCRFPCMCGYTYLTTVFAYSPAGASPQGEIINYTTIPCCPEDVTVRLVSTETLEVTWSPVRGAELYQTTAAGAADVVRCNDTSPVCVLSDLRCDSRYSLVVTPCSELRGCNSTCKPNAHETAPCSPTILNLTQFNSSTVSVLFSAPNGADTAYTVTAVGRTDARSCTSRGGPGCDLTSLPCGATYEVAAVAASAAGRSLPGYSVPLETGPCCPASLSVEQVTQAMTNVTWSPALGARSYVTALTSPRGHAKCHTLDTHCLMGCITCGTNYSVSVEAVSSTGHRSTCDYRGFSSSACCPTSVKLYRMANNSLRVYWRSSGPPQAQNHTVDLYGTGSNYTCLAAAASTSCDVQEVMCGEVYTVVVAPVARDGGTVKFCPHRMYSVLCSGSNVGMGIPMMDSRTCSCNYNCEHFLC
ncbi:fibronectin type III domain-containing protein 7 [Aplochiton taeniatus]